MSVKLSDVERKFSESSSSLTWYKDRVRELDLKLASLEQELLSSKDAASRTEEQSSAKISTLNKLVELYKESSEEWSKKVGELESVIKALEVSLLCSWLFK
ncbi:PREDICTED: nuclear-pore anchor-like [Ipomoea nil]|nr:PREDICTED: nuclear-pore anchor-like [Ipomoea nil]XP_019170419.1 PREDICTED: nuclear-pore anchor-like [Ipomoea nil]